MPFPGNMVPAPVMAARQGMKDIQFAGVTDTGKPVAQYVDGALTGKGSGLLTSTTTTNAAPTTGQMSKTTQAAGQAMSIGGGSLAVAGGPSVSTPGSAVSGAAFASAGGGGMAAQGMAAAQAMMSLSPGSMGSAAAMAGSGLSSPAVTQAASLGSGAAASSASAGGAGIATMPGLQPGTQPASPQFTALPAVQSLPGLNAVLAKLGGMMGAGSGGITGPDALSGSGGSGAATPPASQFDGTAPADATEAEFD